MGAPDLSRQFVLIIQQPKPREVGPGVLSVDKAGEAMFFSGHGESGAAVLASLRRARLDTASANGIMLSGFESTGIDRSGREKLAYQEWWLRYPLA